MFAFNGFFLFNMRKKKYLEKLLSESYDELRGDDNFYIRHNSKYPPNSGNGFLCFRESGNCVGSYEKHGDTWLITISTWINEDHIGQDGIQIGASDNRTQAIDMLWDHRHTINPSVL